MMHITPSGATLSIMGMYIDNPNLFDDLILPSYTDEGGTIHDMERQILIDNILLKGANLEILYPDMDTLVRAIAVWNVSHLEEFNKIWKTLFLDYDPISNYDRRETDTETRDLNFTTDDTDKDLPASANTVTKKVAAFNESTPSVVGEDTSQLSGIDTHTSEYKHYDTGTIKHEIRAYGNIGVTSSQQLLQAERDVAAFSAYDYVADSFIDTMCIKVY